jgi:hypothetical protein
MSQQIGGYPPSTATGAPTAQVARDEAGEVGRTAADAGRHVAGTATEQAANVVDEVKAQSRDLLGEVRGQVQDQVRNGHQKATDGVRALAQELREMADGGERSGTASEIARQVADRGDRLADWLNDREPGDLVEEVRSFARRRPWAFLAGAALAGVVAGRLTRGAVDSAHADVRPSPVPRQGYGEPVLPVAGSVPPRYDDPAGPYTPPSGRGVPAYPAYDTPTPPEGTLPAQSYPAAPPVAPPLPSASTGLTADPDPYAPPADPYTAGRPEERAHVRELDEERLDDPFRHGNGGNR